MKLHSPPFEKALRRGVKRTIKNSPRLKKEAKATNKPARHYRGYLIARPCIVILFSFLVGYIQDGTGNANATLGVISLWSFGFIFIHAGALWTALFRSNDLAVLSFLPLDTPTIFRWEFQKFARKCVWSLIDLIAAFGVLGWFLAFTPLQWFGLVFAAVLTWVFTLALAGLCLTRMPPRWHQLLILVVVPAPFLLFILVKMLGGPAMLSLANKCAPFFNIYLPTGWAVSLFRLAIPGSPWAVAGLLLPVGAIIFTLPNSLSWLRGLYVFHEPLRDDPVDILPWDSEAQMEAGDNVQPIRANPPRAGETLITEIVQTRQFLTQPRFAVQGWWEGLLWQWYSEREKAVSEIVFTKGIAISGIWKKIFRYLAIATAIGLVAGLASPALRLWAFGGGIFITFMMMLVFINYSGAAFSNVACSGVLIPLRTNFPVGLLEISRVLIKFTAIQLPAVLIWSLICGLWIGYALEIPLLLGATYGLRAGLLVVAARYVFIVFSISQGTNDTRGFRFKSFAIVGCVLVLGAAFMGLGAAGILMQNQWEAWGFTLLAMVAGYLFFRVYAWFYGRNFFDLMNMPQRR